MSVPAPRYPGGFLSPTLIQAGGPVAVSSGATSGAITFSVAFPDNAYQVALEWVSGSSPAYGVRAKTVNYAIPVFTAVTESSAFLWRAWRLWRPP